MKIVIPVSAHDSKLINAFCDIVLFFSPYVNHELLVVVRPSDYKHGIEVFNRLSGKFLNPKIYIFDDDGPRGWPKGPNHYWRETVRYLDNTNNKLPWLWMEMDCTPVINGWIDKIENEYIAKANNGCLGNIQSLLTGDELQHMVGAGVYPYDFGKRTKLWKSIDDDSLAFDVHCRAESLPMCKDSKTIGFHFRTRKYDCGAEGMRGVASTEQFIKYLFHRPVSKKTALVHGCNDGSLARLITNT